jgi:hypothetical protein
MPYSPYRPELMGKATLEPSGAFEAGSMQSFTLVYEAGPFGLDDTGSLKIGFRFATDFGPVQFDKPEAPGFTTAEASNGATLELKWEFKRNIRPWSRSLYIGVVREFLRPGDTITVRFGDRRFGAPGIRLQTYCESAFRFQVFADAIATYDYVPLPHSPRIRIVPGPGVAWRAVLPTLVRAGEPFRLGVKAEDRWGNTSDLPDQDLHLRPSLPVSGLPSIVRKTRGAFAAVADELRVAEPGDLVIDVLDDAGQLLCRSNPLRITDAAADWVHYWGDTHGQSDETLGTNSARDYFLFGRDKAFLDVMGHQGNDFQITRAFWNELNELTAEFDKPGSFVCIPGYEWSANTAVGGDRNVHFRREGEVIHRSSHAQITDPDDFADEASDAHTADVLFSKLAGRDCVVVAHVGGRYADIVQAHDGTLETAVEVHSAWGTFEWLLWDALEKNYRVGIVANSDGHKGRPGACYPGASFFGSYGGLTCFLAARLDRDAIFESMRRRHHYGTTGNRMFLNVEAHTVSDAVVFHRDPALFANAQTSRARRLMMGDIAHVDDEDITLNIDVHGSAPIERIDIFDGLRMVETVRPYADKDLGARVRLVYQGAEYRGRARTTVWDGQLTIVGNVIDRVAMFNTWNLDRGIQHQDANRVSWKAVTTGNFGGLDLWFKNEARGSIAFETPHCRGCRDIRALGVDEHVFSAGGLDRAVKLSRLPEQLTTTHMRLSRRLELRRQGDTRLFVRVTQIDGHRAWSSPIYLFH